MILYYYRKVVIKDYFLQHYRMIQSLLSEEMSALPYNYSTRSLWLCIESGKKSVYYGSDNRDLYKDLTLNQVSILCVREMWTF